MQHPSWLRGVTLPATIAAVVACGGHVEESHPSDTGDGGTSSQSIATTGDASADTTGGAGGSGGIASADTSTGSVTSVCPDLQPDPTEPTICGPVICEAFEVEAATVATSCVYYLDGTAYSETDVYVAFDCAFQVALNTDGVQQWKYIVANDVPRIEFYDSTCAALQARTVSVVTVVYGCPVPCLT